MKKYKLLKDTHSNKAGTIFCESLEHLGMYLPENGIREEVCSVSIKETPEWFEEVKEPEFEKKIQVLLGGVEHITKDIQVVETFETLEEAETYVRVKKQMLKEFSFD